MINIETIDEKTYITILNKIFVNKEEERNLALDRYRKADEMMQDENHFMILGKNAAIYLEIASSNTDSLILISKDIKSIVFKNSDPNATTSGGNDELLKKMSEIMKEKKDASSKENNTPEDDDL
jgi:hypothetical protein